MGFREGKGREGRLETNSRIACSDFVRILSQSIYSSLSTLGSAELKANLGRK